MSTSTQGGTFIDEGTKSVQQSQPVADAYGYVWTVNGHYSSFHLDAPPTDFIAGWEAFPVFRHCNGTGKIKVLDVDSTVDDALAKVGELGTVGAMKWLAKELTKDSK